MQKLIPGFQFTPWSCENGMAHARSGRSRAMLSCKSLSYPNAKQLRVVGKNSKKAVARQLNLDIKKVVTSSRRNNVQWRTGNERIQVSERDSMGQSQETK